MLRKPKALALTLATIFAAGCAHSENSASIRSVQWKRGKEPLKGPIRDAVEPKILPETYFAAAQLLEQEGDYAKAVIQYRKATAVNHNYVAAYHRLGVLLTRMGILDEAIQSLATAAKLAPDDAMVRNNHGFALMLNKQWEEAAVQFKKCIEIRPEFARPYINLGMTYARMDRFDDAYQSFRAVLAEPDAYYNLGLMYRARGRNADASTAFRKALAINPDFYAAAVQLNDVDDRGGTVRTVRPRPSTTPTGGQTPRLISKDLTPVSETPTIEVTPMTEVPLQEMETAPASTTTPSSKATREPETVKETPQSMREVDTPVSQGNEVKQPEMSRMALVEPRNPVPAIRPLSQQSETADHAKRPCNMRSMKPVQQHDGSESRPTMAAAVGEESAGVAATQTSRCDVSTLPQPDRRPIYVILGPDKAEPSMKEMRVVDATGEPQANAKLTGRTEVVRATAAHFKKKETNDNAVRMATLVPSRSPTASVDDAIFGVSVDHAVGLSVVDGRNRCFVSDEDVATSEGVDMCVADYAADVLRDSQIQSWFQPSGTMLPVDSEAIISAFESHVYAFPDDELCWDEIDWESWEVIDVEVLASRLRDHTTHVARATVIDVPDQIVERPRSGRSRVTKTVRSTLMSEVRPESDTKLVPMEVVYSDEDLGEFTALESNDDTPTLGRLARELESVRDEIRCWDDKLMTQQTDNTVSVDGSASAVRITPGIDEGAEMSPATPPIECSFIDRIAANQPLVLDRSELDINVLSSRDLRSPMVTSGETTASMEPVVVREPGAGMPVLVRQEHRGTTSRSSPTSQGTPMQIVDWRETFGSLDDKLSIVVNEKACLETKVIQMQPVETVTVAKRADGKRKRQTLSSKVDETKSKRPRPAR